MEPLEGRVLMSATHYQQPVDASPDEQYMLELVNRMRMDPAAELSKLINSSDSDVSFAISYFKVGTKPNELLAQQWKSLKPVGPLAWSNARGQAAESHSKAMLQKDSQFHSSYGPENVYAYADSVFYGHAGFAIDWGGNPSKGIYYPGGILPGHGHRNNIMDASSRAVGIGIVKSTPGKNTGPLLITQQFAGSNNYFLTGVAYNDIVKKDNFYDVGEGLSGVKVSASNMQTGVTYTTNTGASGGYTLKVPPGKYSIGAGGSFSLKGGGGMWWSTGSPPGVDVTSKNLKWDFKFSNPNILANKSGPSKAELPPDLPPLGQGDSPGGWQDMVVYGPGWEDGVDAFVRVRTGDPVYVKGTDLFDTIVITRENDTQAAVTVESFHDPRFSEPLSAPLTHTFDILEGIIVDPRSPDDFILLDPAIAEYVTLVGEAGDDAIEVVLETEVTRELEPIDVEGIAWLHEFEQIEDQDSDREDSVKSAVDEVFATYWQYGII